MSNRCLRPHSWPTDPFSPPADRDRHPAGWLLAGLIPLTALVLVLPAPWPISGWAGSAATGTTGRSADLLDAVVLSVASGLVWGLSAWTMLLALAGTLSRRPGRCGLLAGRVLRRMAPAAARQLFVASVGVSLIGGMSSCASAAPAAGVNGPGAAGPGAAASGMCTRGGGTVGVSPAELSRARVSTTGVGAVVVTVVEGSAVPPGGQPGLTATRRAGSITSSTTVTSVSWGGPAQRSRTRGIPAALTSPASTSPASTYPALTYPALTYPALTYPASTPPPLTSPSWSSAPAGPVGRDEPHRGVAAPWGWAHPARVAGGIVHGIGIDWPGPAVGSPVVASVVVVHRGDTLWAIAARHLGGRPSTAQIDASWRTWYAANRSVIGDDPNLILPGQQLHPPAVPALTHGGTS